MTPTFCSASAMNSAVVPAHIGVPCEPPPQMKVPPARHKHTLQRAASLPLRRPRCYPRECKEGTRPPAASSRQMTNVRTETDSFGEVQVPADKLGELRPSARLNIQYRQRPDPARDDRRLCHREKGGGHCQRRGKRLGDDAYKLIVRACDEIVSGQHHDMFPLHVWMTGSGTQFNMNVNEVISNRCSQIAGTALAANRPCIPTITSTCRNRPMTRFPRRCASPPRSASRGGSFRR